MSSDPDGSSTGGDRSLSFDGGGGHLLVANDGAFDRQESAITVEWWQRLDIGDRDTSTWFPTVIDLGVDGAAGDSGKLSIYFDGRTADGLRVEIDEGHLFTFTTSVVGLDDVWAHFAVVRDGADLRAYRDGNLIGSHDTLTSMPIDANGASLAIGTDRQAITSTGTRFTSSFSGLIADLRVSRTQRYLGASFTTPTAALASDADTLLLVGVADPTADSGPSSREVTTVTLLGSTPVVSTQLPY